MTNDPLRADKLDRAGEVLADYIECQSERRGGYAFTDEDIALLGRALRSYAVTAEGHSDLAGLIERLDRRQYDGGDGFGPSRPVPDEDCREAARLLRRLDAATTAYGNEVQRGAELAEELRKYEDSTMASAGGPLTLPIEVVGLIHTAASHLRTWVYSHQRDARDKGPYANTMEVAENLEAFTRGEYPVPTGADRRGE